jgi:hypothetical protein
VRAGRALAHAAAICELVVTTDSLVVMIAAARWR